MAAPIPLHIVTALHPAIRESELRRCCSKYGFPHSISQRGKVLVIKASTLPLVILLEMLGLLQSGGITIICDSYFTTDEAVIVLSHYNHFLIGKAKSPGFTSLGKFATTFKLSVQQWLIFKRTVSRETFSASHFAYIARWLDKPWALISTLPPIHLAYKAVPDPLLPLPVTPSITPYPFVNHFFQANCVDVSNQARGHIKVSKLTRTLAPILRFFFFFIDLAAANAYKVHLETAMYSIKSHEHSRFVDRLISALLLADRQFGLTTTGSIHICDHPNVQRARLFDKNGAPLRNVDRSQGSRRGRCIACRKKSILSVLTVASLKDAGFLSAQRAQRAQAARHSDFPNHSLISIQPTSPLCHSPRVFPRLSRLSLIHPIFLQSPSVLASIDTQEYIYT
jgi:hypothetical protein